MFSPQDVGGADVIYIYLFILLLLYSYITFKKAVTEWVSGYKCLSGHCDVVTAGVGGSLAYLCVRVPVLPSMRLPARSLVCGSLGGWQRLSLRAAGSPSFPLAGSCPSLCLHRPVCCPLLLGESAVCSDVPVGMSLLVPTRRVPRPNWGVVDRGVCGVWGCFSLVL